VVAEPIPRERSRHLVVVAIALVAAPIVLFFQFVGGAGPQWGGRYLLPSSLLLAVAGWVRLAAAPARTRWLFIGLGVAVTGYGLAWLQVRSHQVDRAIAAIEARPEEVVVSSLGHLAREGGATYGDRRWLTRLPGSTAEDLGRVLTGAATSSVVSVEVDDGSAVARIPGFRAVDRSDLQLFDGVDLRLTSWERAG
jgi:hypothetical protein